MGEEQDDGVESPELVVESDPYEDSDGPERHGGSTLMPWLLPVAAIVAFFAFVALLVFFIL